MLLTLREIQDGLDKEFIPLEPLLEGFRLIDTPEPHFDAARCEAKLQVHLPTSFKSVVGSYDFGRITIGPVAFCNSGDYCREIIRDNRPDEFSQWWGPGDRPNGKVLVGSTESYAIILNTLDGTMSVIPNGEPVTRYLTAAQDFEMLVRGVGSVFLLRLQTDDRAAIPVAIAKAVGGEEGLAFWSYLAE